MYEDEAEAILKQYKLRNEALKLENEASKIQNEALELQKKKLTLQSEVKVLKEKSQGYSKRQTSCEKTRNEICTIENICYTGDLNCGCYDEEGEPYGWGHTCGCYNDWGRSYGCKQICSFTDEKGDKIHSIPRCIMKSCCRLLYLFTFCCFFHFCCECCGFCECCSE
jgi:hypothetical protein